MQKDKGMALERVQILLLEADAAFGSHPERSHQYVRQARRIAMKVRLKLPRALKRMFCKHCYHFLRPGVNCRVRTRTKMVVMYCYHCKKFMKLGLRSRGAS